MLIAHALHGVGINSPFSYTRVNSGRMVKKRKSLAEEFWIAPALLRVQSSLSISVGSSYVPMMTKSWVRLA